MLITCGANYPDVPPVVKFVDKINLPCVAQSDGTVDPNKLGNVGRNWKRSDGIYTLLLGIKSEMMKPDCRKLKQPSEGEVYAV